MNHLSIKRCLVSRRRKLSSFPRKRIVFFLLKKLIERIRINIFWQKIEKWFSFHSVAATIVVYSTIATQCKSRLPQYFKLYECKCMRSSSAETTANVKWNVNESCSLAHMVDKPACDGVVSCCCQLCAERDIFEFRTWRIISHFGAVYSGSVNFKWIFWCFIAISQWKKIA